MGESSERPPRPLGVAAGVPWEPREPVRSMAKAAVTVRLLEALEHLPDAQKILAAALRVVSSLVVSGDTPMPPDAPDEPGSWKFAALGDYGAGTDNQARVAANILKSGAQLVITSGDNVYPTGRWSDYARHWDPPQFMGNLARAVQFMPALGNHDMYRDDLRPYFGHFPHLQGLPYYSYVKNNVQFMAVDSDQDLRVGSAQYRWLEDELKNAKSPWKVVYMHYPMYGSVDEFAEIRKAVQPLLAKYGVQLVVAGHEHNYIRSKPVDGVTHILTGGGGQQVFPFMDKQPEHIARRAGVFHHIEVSVGAKNMVVRAVNEHGERIDTVIIPQRTGASQAAAGAAQVQPRRKRRQRVRP